MRYSILIPAYNSMPYIDNFLDCTLNQSYDGEYEVIVSDDCSTDGTYDELVKRSESDPRLRVIRNEKNEGNIVNRNRLVRAAKGDYIVWLDHDDHLSKDFLLETERILSEKEYDIVDFKYEVVDENGNDIPISWKYFDYEGDDCIQVLFSLKPMGGWILWGKAIRRNVMLNALPPDMRYCLDDVFYVLKMYHEAKSYISRDVGKPMLTYSYGIGISTKKTEITYEKFERQAVMRYASLKYNYALLKSYGLPKPYFDSIRKGQHIESLINDMAQIMDHDERIKALALFNALFAIDPEARK